jgi:SnoaL-like domain
VSPSDHETRFTAFLTAVPTSVERSHIEGVIGRYMATYSTKDVETRLSLFAEALCFEDPVGNRLGSNKAELRSFFESTIASGVSLRFFPERLVVVGDEALQVARLLIERGEHDVTVLSLYLHFVFDGDGLITQVRVFYDAACASQPAM